MALVAVVVAAQPALSEPNVKGWYTMDAMGCMLLRECTKDVQL